VSNVVHVGFTGTQRGMTSEQRKVVRQMLQAVQTDRGAILHHGDCIGADLDAHTIAKEVGCAISLHPPINSTKRAFCEGANSECAPEEYLVRNQVIVHSSSCLIATPGSAVHERRSGTWFTVRYAVKRNLTINIVLPDGSVRHNLDGLNIQ